jgi:hypothetical protein
LCTEDAGAISTETIDTHQRAVDVATVLTMIVVPVFYAIFFRVPAPASA